MRAYLKGLWIWEQSSGWIKSSPVHLDGRSERDVHAAGIAPPIKAGFAAIDAVDLKLPWGNYAAKSKGSENSDELHFDVVDLGRCEIGLW